MRRIAFLLPCVVFLATARATTVQTNTRPEVAQMAGLWEVDSVQISSLANAQYPQYTNSWQYIFPHANISSDGDVHNDMAQDSSGTGSTGNNAGESPIIAEVINATSAQLSHLQAIKSHQIKSRGIFRIYTEHAGERHFEVHPITEVDSWNGSAWVLDSDYHTNIAFDANGTTHAGSTLQQMFTQNMTAQIMADNTNVIFTFTSPNTNYGQFDGVAKSGLLTDSVSPYFWFTPTNPAVSTTVRCRLITNTAAAFNATGLSSNQTVTVNVLTRWDMLAISNNIATLAANQSSNFPAPIEFITLSVSSTGIVSSLPVISGIQVTSVTQSNATIQWTTDVTSDSKVAFGTSPGAVTNQASGTSGVTNHIVNLSGLQPGTQYDFSVSSTSAGGTTTDDNQGSFYSFTTVAPPSLNSIQTVFIILMENQNWASISGNTAAPYINHTLLPMASHAEQYYNPPGLHPSLPNYLWLEAGTNFGITVDEDPSAGNQTSTNHLVTLLKNAGISWTSFQEDISGTVCPLTAVNQYAPKHNPMVYFDDVTNTNNTGAAYCIANVRPYSELASDLQSNVVTRYNFITPNLCDDMHGNTGCPGGSLITQGDTWLSNNIPIILNSQAYSNTGAIFIVWDEGEGGDGPIGMIVLSPLAKGGGYSNTVHYTHSSTLRTMEEIFNVGPFLGDAANATDLSDLFNLGAAQLSVVPASGLASSGTVGGPFSPTNQTYTLSNSGGIVLNWMASKTANWLTLSSTAGTLSPGSNTTVTVSINSNANSLSPGGYSDTVSFTNTTNGAGNTAVPVTLTVSNAAALSVTPASGLTSSGLAGGPFSPTNQTYTLSNSGGATLSWTASNTANWLTLSATAGTLAPGSNTAVIVSINANANSLSAGSYSDTVSFTNTTNGAGNTTRPVSLTVNSATAQLSVAPAAGLTSSGTVGGPFSPTNQTYTLSNSGGTTLSWTASNTANWLTLSATSGTLAPSSNTAVTISVNSNANSLPAGGYSDVVSFTNVTNGAGNTTRAVTLTVTNVLPIIVANGSTLVSEGCTPTNGVIDPGETVTVNFSVENVGSGNSSNLVATLVATNGVTFPSGPQTYGVVAAGGGVATQSFTFTASGACGGGITATLQLQDGASNLGTVIYTFPLGQSITPFAENFDAVTAPALPAGWSTSASGAQSNWVTSIVSADTPPNAAFSPDPGTIGVNELDAPTTGIASASAVLTFRQKYNLLASSTNSSLGYDGGVLEIKIDGGSYTDITAAGGSFVSGGYNTTLSGSYTNPLAGRQAWSANSSGFTTTVVNLPAAAAGQNVQLRWRCGAGSPPSAPTLPLGPLPSSGTLAYWNFDSSSPNPNVTASNISVAAMTLSNAGGSLTYFSGNPGNAIASSGFSTLAGPPTTSYSYFAFALTATNIVQVSLSSISFDDRASGTGPKTFDIQVSQQSNFSTVIYDGGAVSTHSAFTTTPMNTLTLTNAGLTGTVYFRIYAYGSSASAGTWRLDNLNIQGTVTPVGGSGGGAWYIDTISIKDTACCASSTPPTASFTGSPTNGTEPLNVTFIDTSTGTITNRFWNFGDSSTSNTTATTINHTYSAGSYTVSLIVSGPGGSSTNTHANYINVLTAFQAWQVQYFGSTNNPNAAPNADPDGDGQNNLAEFLAGTDPTNNASAFRITSILQQGNDLLITWTMGSGKTNALQLSLGNGNGNYSNNFADLFTVTNTVGTVTNYLDSGAATNTPPRFYRVRLVP